MDTVNTLLPKLRFPEFQDFPAWKKTPLEDTFSLVVRQVKKPENPYTGLGIRSHGKGTFLKNLEIPEKNAMEYLYEVQSDDLIVNITFAWEGAIAIVKKNDSGALVSHRFPTYIFNKDVAIPEFFQYIILEKQFIYNLGIISPGGAGRNRVLNKNDFLKLTVAVPDVPEQQKIADCLTSLDAWIAVQSQKVEALKAYKKGLMQNLFPAEGESVPRLRFPEFQDAGEWEEEKLGNISFFVNERISLEKLNLDNYISTENILPDYMGVIRATKLPPSGSAIQFKMNDILISNIRPYLKKVWLSNKDGGASNDVLIVRAKEKITAKYLSFMLVNDAFIEYVMKGAKGLKMPRGDISLMKEYPLAYPSISEQQRIAEFLTTIDEQISAQSETVAALKVHKKGLMQQLFPSI